jgi:secreted trypsin-like serine protease
MRSKNSVWVLCAIVFSTLSFAVAPDVNAGILIAGGRLAKIADYPWQVSLLGRHFCGGSIYSDRWIVTAAHCLKGQNPKDVTVTAGTDKLGEGGVKRTVKCFIPHPNHNPDTKDNDIALIGLSETLPFNDKIEPIALMTPEADRGVFSGDAVVTGWGSIREGGSTVPDLRVAEVPFVEQRECSRLMDKDGVKVTENMICAGVAEGGVDSCNGDSGGPLTFGTHSDARLVGIVSWGEGCAREGKVGVYTRVSKFARWIADTVASPQSCR